MKVALLQTDIAWERPRENLERAAAWVAEAAGVGARLAVLPEMFACGFSMNTAAVSEDEDGPSARFLRDRARHHRLWLCGSIPLRAAGEPRPANAFVLAGPTGQLHLYSKIQPFSPAGEHEHYRAGDRVVTMDVEGVRVTPFVCYDLRFADLFWAAAPRTDAYVVIANWPSRRRRHFVALLEARAIENQAYAIGVNRVGEGDGLEYAGDSRVVDPWGETLCSAAGQACMLTTDIDVAVVADARTKLPFLSDRSPRGRARA